MEPFHLTLEKKSEANGRGLSMTVLKEILEGRLNIPKVIRKILVMVSQTSKQSLKMVKRR